MAKIFSFPGRSFDYGHPNDFDIEGADWVDITVINSPYEEQLDTQSGAARYRKIGVAHDYWRKGRAPGTHDDV